MKKVKIVNINKWTLDEIKCIYLITHTAKWCAPCQIIKPVLLELMKCKKHLGSKEIPKDDRSPHVKYIPWFDIVDVNGNIISSLQTSKESELREFLKEYSVTFTILDNDF